MKFIIKCPFCGEKYELEQFREGLEAECEKCGNCFMMDMSVLEETSDKQEETSAKQENNMLPNQADRNNSSESHISNGTGFDSPVRTWLDSHENPEPTPSQDKNNNTASVQPQRFDHLNFKVDKEVIDKNEIINSWSIVLSIFRILIVLNGIGCFIYFCIYLNTPDKSVNEWFFIIIGLFIANIISLYVLLIFAKTIQFAFRDINVIKDQITSISTKLQK